MVNTQKPPPSWLFSRQIVEDGEYNTARISHIAHFATSQEMKSRASEGAHVAPPLPLLDLVEAFLKHHSFDSAHRALSKQRKQQGLVSKQVIGIRKDASLLAVFSAWQALDHGASAGSESQRAARPPERCSSSSDISSSSESGSGSVSGSSSDSGEPDDIEMGDATASASASAVMKSDLSDLSSTGSSSSESGSESDSDSDGDETTVSKVTKAKSNETLKRKASSSSSSSTSSDSGSSSKSETVPGAKRRRIEVESSSSDSTSDSDSENAGIAQKAVAIPLPSSDASTSSSDSGSDSDLSSKKANGSKSTATKDSSDSSVTLGKTSPNLDTSTMPPLPPDPTLDTARSKLKKKQNQPFSRIPKGIKVDDKFASNAYVSIDYSQRAHNDLIVTKGKGFTKEKNKKKRGSYKGGMIDIGQKKGVYFDD